MNWTDLIKEICARTGLPQDQVKDVMGAQREIVLEALARGEDVPLAGVGTLGSRWQEARTLRSLQEQRKIMIDGRFIARFRPGKQIRDVLLSRTPQLWREPSHCRRGRLEDQRDPGGRPESVSRRSGAGVQPRRADGHRTKDLRGQLWPALESSHSRL